MSEYRRFLGLLHGSPELSTAHFRNALHRLSQHYIFKLPTHYVVDGIYKMVAQVARFHTGFFARGGARARARARAISVPNKCAAMKRGINTCTTELRPKPDIVGFSPILKQCNIKI